MRGEARRQQGQCWKEPSAAPAHPSAAASSQGPRGSGPAAGAELADALPEVEGELEHGGSQALVDQGAGQAALRGQHGAVSWDNGDAGLGDAAAAGSCRSQRAGSGGGTAVDSSKKALHDSTQPPRPRLYCVRCIEKYI